MANFCPQCGSKLQPVFKFCPSCGNKLPEEDLSASQPPEPYPNTVLSSPSALEVNSTGDSPRSELVRQPLRSTRRKPSNNPDTESIDQKPPSSSRKRKTPPLQTDEEQLAKKPAATVIQSPDKAPLSSPRKGKCPPLVKEEEEAKQNKMFTLQTPDKIASVSPGKHNASPHVKEEEPKHKSPVARSPSACKSRKRVSVVEPVMEGTILCDQSSKKWKLVKLLWKTEIDLTYSACQAKQLADSDECKYMLRLGAKEGHLFNEQNFHLRAAKPDAVDKWMKQNKMEFLGIPSCAGFGLHNMYRYVDLT
ncbi:hypothetical protein DNTS_016077 [Danionella cerebrum]|uniref:Zinc-ribbon domain-containing protein n=1 Tax=Danionella cerebrum TaxID=2873325 RepID=A0A553QHU8_9TELE|nr:hypothetical protein DNTS_016077 [Danionella translucida]